MDALILRRHAAGPTGQPTTLDERISEVQRRYQADNPVPPETSRKQRSGRRERLQLVGRGTALPRSGCAAGGRGQPTTAPPPPTPTTRAGWRSGTRRR